MRIDGLTGLIVLILGVWTSLPSCYKAVEGCTDPDALNYDVKADNACESCCKYPKLQLTIEHLYEGAEMDTNTLLTIGQDLIRIRSLIFLLTDFRMVDGTKYDTAQVSESIQLGADDTGLSTYFGRIFPAAKVRLGRTTPYELGTFPKADLYQGVHFDFGVNPEVNHAIPDKIPSSHALYKNADSLYIDRDQGYYFLKMIVSLPGGDKEFLISGDDRLVSLKKQGEFDFRERAVRELTIVIDYGRWFEGIDFSSMSQSEIEEKLYEGISPAFLLP